MNNNCNESEELNLQNTSEENKNTSYDNNIITEDNNENLENKDKSCFIDEMKNYNNNNDKINLDELNEEENNQTIEQEEEFPLITLNFISICQCCKNRFE